jgi:hypothetical protein
LAVIQPVASVQANQLRLVVLLSKNSMWKTFFGFFLGAVLIGIADPARYLQHKIISCIPVLKSHYSENKTPGNLVTAFLKKEKNHFSPCFFSLF